MRLIYPALVSSCLVAAAVPALAQGDDDGSRMFLNLYSTYQKAELLEKKGDNTKALALYQEVAKACTQMSSQYPAWSPQVVKFRSQQTARAIERIQSGASPSSSGAPATGTAGSSGRAPLPPPPSLPDFSPTPSAKPAPESVVSKPGSAAPSASDRGAATIPQLPQKSGVPVAPSDPFAEIQGKLGQLQTDLQFALDEAQRLRREKSELAKELAETEKARDKAEGAIRLLEQRSDVAERALLQAREDKVRAEENMVAMTKEQEVIRSKMKELQAERDAAQELKQRAEGRLAQTQGREAAVETERDNATKQVGELNKKLSALQGDLDKAAKAQSIVQEQLAKVVAERDAAKAATVAAARERDAAKEAAKEAERASAKAKADAETAKSVVAKANTERDDALALAAKLKTARGVVEKLEAENKEAASKLARAQEQINQARQNSTSSEESVKALKTEVSEVRKQMEGAQKKVETAEKSVSDLQSKLDTAVKETVVLRGELNQTKTEVTQATADREREHEEKELLQGILSRSLQAQAKRDKSSKDLVAEVSRLKVSSDALIKQIGMLGEPVLQLSEKEQALFKQPMVEISEDGISISALKSTAADSKKPSAKNEESGAKPSETAKPGETPKTGNSAVVQKGAKIEDLDLSAVAGGESPVGKPSKEAGKEAPKAVMDSSKGANEATKPSKAPEAALAMNTKASSGAVAEAFKPAGGISDEVRVKMTEAKDRFEKGDFVQAEKLYKEVLAASPGNAFVFSNLGVTQFRAKRLPEAEESLRKAIELSPEDSFSRSTLGIVYYTQGKFDKAVDELTQSVAINPSNAIAHNYLGIAASRKGWQENARKELETACALDPNYADAFFNLAVVCASQRPADRDAAKAAYETATKLGAAPDPRLEELLK
jgi:Flp pilus assembly protein TadD